MRVKAFSVGSVATDLVASCYGMAEKLTDISQLEEAFHLAAERITKNKTLKVGTDEKLKLYSYYKQVSII